MGWYNLAFAIIGCILFGLLVAVCVVPWPRGDEDEEEDLLWETRV